MKEKENLFLRVKRQRIDEVEMVEIKKNLYVANSMIIVSGKNHQWMLKLRRKSLNKKQNIYIDSKYFPIR